MITHPVALLFSSVLILLGLVGVVVPILPGPPIAFAGLLLYAYVAGLNTISSAALIFFFVLVVMSFLTDFFLPGVVASRSGATRGGIWGASIGLLLGILVMGPVGVVLGPVLGAIVGELISGTQLSGTARPAAGALVGFVISTAFKLLVVCSMLGYLLLVLVRAS